LTRIFAGQHFSFDLTSGQHLGREVADFVLDNFLDPVAETQEDNNDKCEDVYLSIKRYDTEADDQRGVLLEDHPTYVRLGRDLSSLAPSLAFIYDADRYVRLD